MALRDGLKNILSRTADYIGLGAETGKKSDFTKVKRVMEYVPKTVAVTRQDIAKWNVAQNLTMAEEPKNYLIQLLFNDAGKDALLTSQIQNRLQQSLSVPFRITNEKGDEGEEQTMRMRETAASTDIITAIWEKRIYGYNLIELLQSGDEIKVVKLPRTNVVPQKGLWYRDYNEDESIPYRTMKEFGKWILEFDNGDLGLMNKAVPHVLFKKFAHSCWSELGEIYGIPPRVLKTNTMDKAMLNRAEAMMRDMSAAAWFIIDESETFEFAKAVDTNGDIFKNLMAFCNNEMSLLMSGAIIGQDTQFGSRGKEQSSQEQLALLVKSDLAMIEMEMNSIVIPALVDIGFLKGKPKFKFDKVDDLNELWKMTREALAFYTVDAEWAKNKFGIEITGERQQPQADNQNNKLNDDDYFNV
jgi:phage gp29-like protein